MNGLSSGHVLHAEPVDNVLDLGRVWLGALVGRLNDAGRGFRRRVSESAGVPDVDAGEVLGEVRRLHALLGADDPDCSRIMDSLKRTRAAANRVSGPRTRDAVNPLSRLARITPEHRALGERINATNRAFWAQRHG